MKIAYVIWCVLNLYLLAWGGYTGWQLTKEPVQVLPADVRQSPGGYRSFHFWHSGWQGGK